MKTYSKKYFFALMFLSISFLFFVFSCSSPAPTPTPAPQTEQKAELYMDQKIERGEYLVNIGGCNDCHSPKIMTPQGPEVDSSRLLSGSPSDMKLPAINEKEITPGKWYLAASDLTAWVGPWGVSYAVNLSPDSATGTGAWSEELFIKILRSGKFMGVDAGRPIMPPMPWQSIRKLSDEDLKCIYAYLQSITPIKNLVHAYVPPNEIASLNK